MNFRKTSKCLGVSFLFSLFCVLLSGQSKGILYGVVTDGTLNQPLSFATVGISALSVGTTTDLDGKYRLTNLPAGKHQVSFSYLGYETQVFEVEVSGEGETNYNVTLSEGGITIDEVVVTGQASGQRAAINQQISSNTIVNVVSKEKLQELPDQNAAEAVGRLAGVSVYRDAGEGQRISIRGISPRFNSVTINGERLPSTEESDRSVDLSMISPDMLAGIELFKAVTPDMDGDAVGGAVNFTVKKADPGVQSNIRLLSGYNDLKNDFGQFRGNFSLSNRFFNDKLGFILTGNYQRANRSNEFRITDYVFEGVDTNEEPILSVNNHNLGDKLETRDRYGGSLTLDYTFDKDHSILLSSSLGRTDRDELRYRRRYRIGENYQEYDIRQRERYITLLANTLSGKHVMGNFEVDWRGSFAFSDQDTPNELSARFRETAAIDASIENERDINVVSQAFKNNLENTILRDSRFNSTRVDEDRFTSQLDLKYNFSFGKKLKGHLKTGVKYRHVQRSRDREGLLIRPYLPGDNPAIGNPELFVTNAAGQILLANFIGTYTNDNFYGGDFDILPGNENIRQNLRTFIPETVDIGGFNDLFGTNYNAGDGIGYPGHLDINKAWSFYNRFQNEYSEDLFINSGDYEGHESVLASYLMATLNIGKRLTLLGGVRFEETDQEYTSFIVTGSLEEDEDNPGTVTSKTAGRRYGEWLPMAHLKYNVAPWMDVRAAVTKTLARPNFFNIVPWEYINLAESVVSFGNPNLLHTTAWNYDLFFSFYNKFGLFTVGGFYKELENIDFIGTITVTDPDDRFSGFTLTEPRNTQNTSTVRGVEFDFQANMRPLGGWLGGLILGANLTLAESETFYPLFQVESVFVGPPRFFETIVLDTVRSGSIVGQADLIANLTLGYEKGGFSGRVSMIYQSDALSPGNPGIGSSETGVGQIPEKDFFDQGFYRFDMALKQRLDKAGKWTVMLNLNNFTNTPERAFLGIADRLRDEEFYGMTVDLGLQIKFRK